MRFLRNFSFAVLLFAFFQYAAFAQFLELKSKQTFPINISSHVGIYKDSSAKLTLEQARNQVFAKNTKDHFLFPYTNDVFWIKLKLKNSGILGKDFAFTWSNPLVEQLDFYVSDSTGKGFFHKQQKILTVEKQKTLIDQSPSFPFSLMPQETKDIYVKVTSKRGQYASIEIHTKDSYYQSRLDDFSEQGFLNGLIIFRLFLVLTLSFFIVKDQAFNLYALHTLIRTFAFWGFINVAGPWFTDNPDLVKTIDFLLYNSVPIGAGIFVYFTQIKGKLPKIHKFTTIAIVVSTLFENTIVFFDYQWYWLKMGAYSIIISAAYFSGLYLYSIRKNIAIQKYYALPFILGLSSYAMLYVRLLGWIEYKPLYMIALVLFFGEIFIFVIFLGGIFRSEQQKLDFNVEQNKRLKELDNIKTNFFTNISHEFRTPLTLILAPIQDLVNANPTNNTYQIMHRNAQRLLELINQLLEISKIEAGEALLKLQKVNLPVYFRRLTSSFTSLAESRGIVFVFSQNADEGWANIDTDKMDKIVSNLLSNAFKFTESGKKVAVNIAYQANQVVFEIQDEGIGMREDLLGKIFNRFYQIEGNTNRKFGGSGIGLALVKELVEVMQGKITVKSQEGAGTTFKITLPMRIETSHKSVAVKEILHDKVESRANGAEQKSEVVDVENEQLLLIIDDNADIRAYIKSIFEDQYTILTAENGKEGIKKAKEHIPDLIISDLMMPEMGGFEFCKKIKTDEKTSHIPIIMLTAKADVESIIEGLEQGADDYLVKPFNKKEIVARVQNLIETRDKLKKRFGKEIVNLNPDEVKVRSLDANFLTKTKVIIELNLSEPQFDVKQFADGMNMSAVQLRRKIKSLTNCTLVEYVRIYRLQKAADLLSQNSAPVSEIAYQVGFESLPYFSRAFQEYFGVSPSEYKSK